MSKNRKRRVHANLTCLHTDLLELKHLAVMCGVLIKARDKAFEVAEEARKENNLGRAAEQEGKGKFYNEILCLMDHPAAIV